MRDRLKEIIELDVRMYGVISRIRKDFKAPYEVSGDYEKATELLYKKINEDEEIKHLMEMQELNKEKYIEEKVSRLLLKEKMTLSDEEYKKIYDAEYEYYKNEVFLKELFEYRKKYCED